MAITKQKKQEIVAELKDKVDRQKAMVFVGITGIKVKDIVDLRKRLKKAGGELKVVKKNLAEIVLKGKKMAFEKGKYKTEIALAFGYEDEISPAKTVYQFSKENDKVQILGGFLENNPKNIEEIIALAQLPSKEELLAKLVGSISSPLSGLANVLQGNIKGLINVLAKAKL